MTKCPLCEYVYKTDFDLKRRKRPKEQEEIGEFFYLQLKMERNHPNSFFGRDDRQLVGCPKCRGVFLSDY